MEADGSGALIESPKQIPAPHTLRCAGCGRCVAACPQRLLTLETSGFRKAAIKQRSSHCTNCGNCVESCLINALSP